MYPRLLITKHVSMTKLHKEAQQYIAQHIGEYHADRLTALDDLELATIIKRRNPYLFEVKNMNTAGDIVRAITDAHLSSSEETKFGDWLERLAIHMNKIAYGGHKATAGDVDLEFKKDAKRYLVTIKSGPNWVNSSQKNQLKLGFNKARRRVKTSGGEDLLVAVEGICYGRTLPRFEYKADGDYYRYCGQKFWDFITGDDQFYLAIIEPLAHKAKEKNEEFDANYQKKLNVFTKMFLGLFCDKNGDVDWDKLVKYVSSVDRHEWKRTTSAT
jgi:hypothetical protein